MINREDAEMMLDRVDHASMAKWRAEGNQLWLDDKSKDDLTRFLPEKLVAEIDSDSSVEDAELISTAREDMAELLSEYFVRESEREELEDLREMREWLVEYLNRAVPDEQPESLAHLGCPPMICREATKNDPEVKWRSIDAVDKPWADKVEVEVPRIAPLGALLTEQYPYTRALECIEGIDQIPTWERNIITGTLSALKTAMSERRDREI